MSSYHTASERALARMALGMHGGGGLRVLVGGLGLGSTAHEVLASERVRQVEVVEVLPQVIGWLERGLIPLAEPLRADPRLVVVEGDVYARMVGPASATWDLILIDVDHAPDEHLAGANAAFYTEAGLAAAGRHLSPGGVLGVWSYAENSPFADALRTVYAEVRVEPVTFENELIDTEETDWLFFARGGRSS